MYLNDINTRLLVAQFLVSGEADLFWHQLLISNQCALQSLSTRRWDQQGVDEGFSTEE